MSLKTERLRIAMLSVHSSPMGELGTQDTGGMSVYIRELAGELGRRGHRVDIYTRLHDPRQDRTVPLSENVRLIHLRGGTKGHVHKWALHPHLPDFCWELETYRAEQGIHYDLVHSHYWLSGLVGNWARDKWEVPHIILFHTLGALKNMTVEAEREPDFRLAAERELVATCDLLLAPTPRERDHLIRHYGARLEKIAVVPCGVNLERFRPIDKARARQQLGFSPEEAIVLFVGRFAPLKGIERLLAAATHLQEPRRLRLVIVGGNGDGTPESQQVRHLSEFYGIHKAVTLAGRVAQEQLPPYYSAADVLVVPSYYESFGLVALESLACGTPVVATEVGVMPSILREGVNGCVVSEGSPRALAQGIDRVLGSTRLFSGEIIRGSVLRFSWKHVAAAMIDQYNTLLRCRRGDSDSSGTLSAMAQGACASASTGRG